MSNLEKLGKFAIEKEDGTIIEREYPKLAGVEEPEYPSEWFGTAPKKPPLTVIQYDGSMDDLIRVVDEAINSGTLDVDVAVHFMYQAGKKIKGRVSETWTSHGVTIAEKDAEICPWDLLEVTTTPGGAVPGKTSGTEPRNEDALLGIIVMLHRLIVVQERGTDAYKTEVQDKCATLLAQPPYNCKDTRLAGAGQTYHHWRASRPYLTMIAALDMFFTEFPLVKHSKLRMGTIPSRYKDCAIINTIHQLEVVADMTADKLFCWCFLDVLVRDIIRISKPGQELGNKRSYTPYMSDMGLSKRSPYSAGINASLHVWCHCVGTFLKSKGSPRARIPAEVSKVDIIRVAEILGFAKRSSTQLVMRIFEDHDAAVTYKTEREAAIPKTDEADLKDDEDEEEDIEASGASERSAIPKKLDPKAWFQLFSQRDYVSPPVVGKYLKGVVEAMQTPRKDSIGEMLMEHYKGLKG
ncbi:nucleoprotein [Norway mononegavirus 1]|uniref:Nucleoprotein n=1 Tax=Norway mononegavirus 1 TaxID=2034335 RepID=A0A286N608_9RHAB|nr:nucleoprotein [Norway mononegavirus 1]